jgi:UDP-glucose 4-epimerase
MPSQNVLITGVTSYWGRRLVTRLATTPLRLLGLDTSCSTPPNLDPEFDFIQTDLRDPELVDQLRSKRVDTVCHLQFLSEIPRNERTFQLNVMGTIRLLRACAEAGVEKVILKSSTAVYGAHANNSAFLSEERALQGNRNYGYLRDRLEIENFCDEFSRQVPHLTLTRLRFSSIIGPTADTPMTRFLKSPQAPVLLGFDPMMQVVHERDVVEAMAHAIWEDVAGAFNVAARQPLPLSRLIGLTDKLPLPILHLLAYRLPQALRPALFPIPPDYLRYPWVGDLTRMQKILRFQPRYSAPDALKSLAAAQRVKRYAPRTETREASPTGPSTDRPGPEPEETKLYG